MGLTYHNDRNSDKCKIVTNNVSMVDSIIASMGNYGFVLHGIVTFQPKYFLFGKLEYTLNFEFKPSIEVFERQLQEAIKREDYRMAVIYRNKIKQMLGE